MLSLCLALAAASPVRPDAATYDTRVLIYTLSSTPTLAGLAQHLSDELLVHVGRAEDIVAVSQIELEMLVEHEKDKHALLACRHGEACMARLYAVAQADKVITGHLGRWGRGYLATLRLTNAETAAMERGETCTGETVAELVEAARAAADRLLGHAAPSLRAPLALGAGASFAVVDLAAYEVRAELASNLSQLLALELKRFEGAKVITPADVLALLQLRHDVQAVRGDDDVTKLIEIGGALGVDYLVGGAVGRLDDTFVIHLRLLDVGRAEVGARISESLRGGERQLAQALRFGTARLLGADLAGLGALSVLTNVDEGALALDGGEPLDLPLGGPLRDLAAGKHAISVRAPGYFSLHEEAYVEADAAVDLVLNLTPIPVPWYARWWVWTAVGAVAAGATTATLLLTQAPDGSEGEVGF